MVFIVPHMDIELEDNKQFISNIPRTFQNECSSAVYSSLSDTGWNPLFRLHTRPISYHPISSLSPQYKRVSVDGAFKYQSKKKD